MFKKAVLERLEAFKDFNTDWKCKSGFSFLNLTTKEYYLQRDFERIIEHYIRNAFMTAGIDELIITDSSTALMESLCIMIRHGWQVIGTYEATDKWGDTRHGLRIRFE